MRCGSRETLLSRGGTPGDFASRQPDSAILEFSAGLSFAIQRPISSSSPHERQPVGHRYELVAGVYLRGAEAVFEYLPDRGDKRRATG